MPLISHPLMGPVECLPKRLRPDKTRRHFYASWERWDQVWDVDPASLLAEARIRGCRPPQPGQLNSKGLSNACRRILHEHHDAAYFPAYENALKDPDSQILPKRGSTTRLVVLSPLGVFMIVGTAEPLTLITAFRPTPQHTQLPTLADFIDHSRWYFHKNTGDNVSLYEWSDVEYLLADASAANHENRRVWCLAVAVGISQALQISGVQKDSVNEASFALSQASLFSKRAVIGSVDGVTLAERLLDAIFSSKDLEEVELALSQFEEGLLALGSLGAKGEVESSLGILLKAFSASSPQLRLDSLVKTRYGQVLSVDHPLAHLKKIMEGASNQKIGQSESLADLVARVGQSYFQEFSQWVDSSFSLQPCGVMNSTTDRWELVYEFAVPDCGHLRLFACDDDHPEGYEVTHFLDGSGAALWQVDSPGDWVMVVAFASDSQIKGETLADVEAFGQRDSRVLARYKRFNRPS